MFSIKNFVCQSTKEAWDAALTHWKGVKVKKKVCLKLCDDNITTNKPDDTVKYTIVCINRMESIGKSSIRSMGGINPLLKLSTKIVAY